MANIGVDPTIVDSRIIEEGNRRTLYVIHHHDRPSTTTGSRTTTTTTTGSKRSEVSAKSFASASTDPTIESVYRSENSPPCEKLPFLGNQALYFTDGMRLIDFILVYNSSSDVPHRLEKERWRMQFQDNLERYGLQMEMAEENTMDKTCYVKVHTPWKTLKRFAEVMKIRMPIAKNNIFAKSSQIHCQPKWSKKLDYDKELLSDPQQYFTAWFSYARINKFLVHSKDTFFTPAQRSVITYFIMCRTVYEDVGDVSMNKVGMEMLLANDAYISAFPLHSGDFLYSGTTNLRNLLYETWGKPSNFWKCQPFDHIKMYFGSKIAWYFSWLGVYTVCLVPAAVIGLIVFMYGMFLELFADKNEICANTQDLIMCPTCDKTCKYKSLAELCEESQHHLRIDNALTIPHTIFVVVWGRVFLLYWKRHQNILKHHWAVHDYEAAEVIRPQFMAVKGKRVINPVNNIAEPALPCASKTYRMSFSLSLTLVMLAMVIIALIGVVVYRTATKPFFTNFKGAHSTHFPLLGSISANILNVVCIGVLSRIYKILAYRMTDFETPRTQSDWEDSFIIKSFLFEFINHNAPIFYVTFFKGNFIGSPNKYTRTFGTVRYEECEKGGCAYETFSLLLMLTIGQLLWNNVQEIVTTKISHWWRERKSKNKNIVSAETLKKSKKPWEIDYLLEPLKDTGIIDEYLEIILQFATITIHASAFPIGALLGLIGNVLEIRVDAYKFVTEFRRPVAYNTQGIGIWVTILQGICYFAVIANSATLAFSSDIIPKFVYNWFEYDKVYGNFQNFSYSIINVTHLDPLAIPDVKTVNDPAENVTICRYKDFRFPSGHQQEYEFNDLHFKVLSFRLGFMVLFNLTIGILSWIFAIVVRETPRKVKQQALREIYLAQKDSISEQGERNDAPDEVPKDRGEAVGR